MGSAKLKIMGVLISCLAIFALVVVALMMHAQSITLPIAAQFEDAGIWRVGRFTFTNESRDAVWIEGYELGGAFCERHEHIAAKEVGTLTVAIPATVTGEATILFWLRKENKL